eukprot:CAMPEP_0167747640 /NCGR_PEP_ID=MMETSP0110_2-20121227/4396_1 /TAXON_ID=629695 /ORGANISM="Gymnochlora sp., Strain CCMP2014" /LENGTH=423 /DNA_ID=CAMNT_0007632569 /DNA_START=227 /DNA_END=1495 /DNA_ORIENTATION=-
MAVLAYPHNEVSPKAETKESKEDTKGEGSMVDKKGASIPPTRPELRIISVTSPEKPDEVSSDSIPVRGYEQRKMSEYSLTSIMGPEDEALYYIISPQDIVVARPRDWDDHLTWLINHEQYEEALKTAESKQAKLKLHKISDIRENYLKHLVKTNHYATAARACPKLLQGNAHLWESWIFYFAEEEKLSTIAPYIPVRNPQLDSKIYELVLRHYIDTDPSELLKKLRIWPKDVYSIIKIISAVIDRLNQKVHTEQRPDLMRALGELYMMDEQFEKAMQVYLNLKSDEVFKYVRSFDLINFVKDYVLQMMQLDEKKTVALFMESLHRFTIREVAEQLESHPRLLHVFLDALFKRDPNLGAEFHNRQVELYAEFEPKSLLGFLKNSNFYLLETALKVCSSRKLYNEMVLILKRMGSNTAALKIILH